MLDALPATKHATVRAALTRAFGTDLPDAPPAPMTGGMSGAALYRIRVGGIAYVLRLEPEVTNPFHDPVRAYGCMTAAADACLAPTVRHADPETGVVIMDLIAERPLLEYAGGRTAMLTELAQAVRVLHRTPPFPAHVEYLQGMDTLFAWFRGLGLSTSEAEELIDRFTAFRATYRTPPEDLVSSHNDLNPRNVLYDGRRLWLIDWDAAFLADRYVDLAALANSFARDEAETRTLHTVYLNREPTPAETARLAVMREVNRLFYGLMFAISAADGTPRAVDLAGAPAAASLRAGIGGGTFDLWQAPNRLTYGSALLAEALSGFRSAAFERDLALAA